MSREGARGGPQKMARARVERDRVVAAATVGVESMPAGPNEADHSYASRQLAVTRNATRPWRYLPWATGLLTKIVDVAGQ